jgi:hypothetical protein
MPLVQKSVKFQHIGEFPMSKDAKKWSLIVGGILGAMLVADGLLIAFAIGDGGPQPIENAYDKALDWDKTHPAPAAAHIGTTGQLP